MCSTQEALKTLSSHLNTLVEFILPVLPLANSHLTQFISMDQWNIYLSDQLKEDLLNVEWNKLHLIPCALLFESSTCIEGDKEKVFPNTSLESFLNCVRSLKTIDSRRCIKSLKIYSNEERLKDERFLQKAMSKKKAHEVACMSNFIKNSCKEMNLNRVIDLGSGLGYLSSVLFVQHQLKVVSVDSSSLNVARILKRCKVIESLYQCEKKSDPTLSGSKIRSKGRLDCRVETKNNLTSFRTSEDDFIGLTKFVTKDEKIDDFLPKVGGAKGTCDNSVGIVGLHTCGDLSAASLKLYTKNRNVKFICNIGCCYHLLKEEFIADEDAIDENSDGKRDNRYHSPSFDPLHRRADEPRQNGFPLSSPLRSIKFALGRNARDLATKLTNDLSPSDKNLEYLFWRALLEVIITEICAPLPKESRIKGKINNSSNFHDYCMKALNSSHLRCKITDEEINRYYEEYKSKKDLLIRFYFLKVSLAPLIEKLILLDRVVFLMEQGFPNSGCIQLFEERMSPRNYAVFSYK